MMLPAGELLVAGAAPMLKAVAGALGMPLQKVMQKTLLLPHGGSEVPVMERQAGNGERLVALNP